MTITQLRYFLVLTEHMNFTHAAKELFISQSTLSQHILKLENELGVVLFHRKNVGLSLTLEGKYLQSTAATLLKELDSLPQALAEVRRISQENAVPKEFSIAVDNATFSMDAPMTAKFVSAVQELSALHPETEIIVSDIANDAMAQRLLDKKVDVTVGGFHLPKSNRITSKSISSQHMNLLIKRQPQWEGFEPTIEDAKAILNELDVLTINFDEQHTLNTQRWLEQVGYQRVLKFADSPWMLQFQLQIGNIAAIVPSNRLDAGFDTQNLSVFPIDELFIPRYISWHSDGEHPLLQEFLARMS